MSSVVNMRTEVAVASLVLLQVLSVITVWTLDNVGGRGQAEFALFIGVNLVAFSIVSYIYRVDKRSDLPNKGLLLSGLLFALLLLLTAFFI